MSHDYYDCDGCTSTICLGNSDEVDCECGHIFCTEKCGNFKNYQSLEAFVKLFEETFGEEGGYDEENFKEIHRVDKNEPVTCSICRNETYNDAILFNALMKHYKLTKKQVIEIWKKQHKSPKK